MVNGSEFSRLSEILVKTIENLLKNSLAVTQVLADAGYSSAAALQALDRYGINSVSSDLNTVLMAFASWYLAKSKLLNNHLLGKLGYSAI